MMLVKDAGKMSMVSQIQRLWYRTHAAYLGVYPHPAFPLHWVEGLTLADVWP
jgi:hypothetical protein